MIWGRGNQIGVIREVRRWLGPDLGLVDLLTTGMLLGKVVQSLGIS